MASSDSRGSQYAVTPLSCSCPAISADNFDHQKWDTQWWNATILQLTSEPSQWRTSQPNMPPVLKLEIPPVIQSGIQILSSSFRPSVTRLQIQQPHFTPWPFHMSFFHLSLKPETLGMCEFQEDRGVVFFFFFHFMHRCVSRCLINNCWMSQWTERQRLPPGFAQTGSSACNVFSCWANKAVVIIQHLSGPSSRCPSLPQTQCPTSSAGLFVPLTSVWLVSSHCSVIYLPPHSSSLRDYKSFQGKAPVLIIWISPSLFTAPDTEEVLSKDILNEWVSRRWLEVWQAWW